MKTTIRLTALFFILLPTILYSQRIQGGGLTFEVSSLDGGKLYHEEGSIEILLEGLLSHPAGAVTDPLYGKGRQIQMEDSEGGIYRFTLYERIPFLFIEVEAELSGSSGVGRGHLSIPRIRTEDFGLDCRTMGSAGLKLQQDSYTFLAAVDSQSGSGVVSGWLTQHEGSGLVFTTRTGGQINLFPRLEFGSSFLTEPGDRRGDLFVVAPFSDTTAGLRLYGELIARTEQIQLKKMPFILDSGFQHPDRVIASKAEAGAAALNSLIPDRGLSSYKIDSGWQEGRYRLGNPGRDFSRTSPARGFKEGMGPLARQLALEGQIPGLWLMPFSVDPDDPSLQKLVLKRENGEAYQSIWGGYALDLTRRDAIGYLRNNIRRITREWGFRLLELEGLWTGMGTELCYISRDYKEDALGAVDFFDQTQSPVEVYRSGMELIRKEAGPETFLLGSSAAQNMRVLGSSFGLLDAMKLGPEGAGRWKETLESVRAASSLFFLNGTVWYNDADVLFLQPDISWDQAELLATWVGFTGTLPTLPVAPNMLSSRRRGLLESILPVHEGAGKPMDLFRSEIPKIWQMSGESGSRGATSQRMSSFPWHLLAVFNWESSRARTVLDLEELGFSPDTEMVFFDYWNRQYLGVKRGEFAVKLSRRSCLLLSARQRRGHPFLLGSSGHITQGVNDLLEERWSDSVLFNRVRVQKDKPLELYYWCEDRKFRELQPDSILLPVEAVEAGAVIRVKWQKGSKLVLEVQAPFDGEVTLNLDFSPWGSLSQIQSD